MGARVVRRRKHYDGLILLISLFLILVLIGTLLFRFFRFLKQDALRTNEKRMQQFELFYDLKHTIAPPNACNEATTAIAARKLILNVDVDPGKLVTEYVQITDALVPETYPVDDSYFNDAIFIGDSITLGMKNSGVIPAKNILAAQNVGIISVLGNNPVYYVGSKKLSLRDAIQAQLGAAPKKIYVLLGLNGLPGATNESQITQYNKLVDQLQADYPGAIIYLQSLTPMTANSEYQKRFTQKKIDELNAMLLAMAKEQGVYFINVQEALRDENGCLIKDYAYKDGLHMVSNGHKVMVKYYKSHVVDEDGYAYKVIEKGE